MNSNTKCPIRGQRTLRSATCALQNPPTSRLPHTSVNRARCLFKAASVLKTVSQCEQGYVAGPGCFSACISSLALLLNTALHPERIFRGSDRGLHCEGAHGGNRVTYHEHICWRWRRMSISRKSVRKYCTHTSIAAIVGRSFMSAALVPIEIGTTSVRLVATVIIAGEALCVTTIAAF